MNTNGISSVLCSLKKNLLKMKGKSELKTGLH